MKKKVKNKTLWIFIGIIVIVLLIVIFILFFNRCGSFWNIQGSDCYIEDELVCFVGEDEVCFNVEIADSDEERQKGLMNRENLNEDFGMLFIFQKSDVYNFWMKDTLIPLDMIWIDENMKVVFIKENATPLSEEIISPNIDALYVLEVNSGIVGNYGIENGEKVEINLN